MKIALTTSGIDLDAPLDRRFGRAPRFVIYNTDFDTYHVKDNHQNLNAVQDSETQAAKHLCDEKVDCVITGECGSRACKILSAAGIAAYFCPEGTLQQALDRFHHDELSEQTNVKLHWV